MIHFAIFLNYLQMCLNPIPLKNPNYKASLENLHNCLKDCSNQYIYVPCGHCPQCIALRQSYIAQRVEMEALVNHIFFCTLTYDNEHLPKLTTSTGFEIAFADFNDFVKMMKRIRRHSLFSRSLRYLAVSERGSFRGRPHFHVLFFVPKYVSDDYYVIMNLERELYELIKFEWRTNKGSNRVPIWEPLFSYVSTYKNGRLSTNFDLHYVNSSLTANGESDVSFYVTKYMLKPSDKESKLQQALHLNLPEDEYKDIYKLVRSKYTASKNFGLGGDVPSQKIIDYLKLCIKRTDGAIYPFPTYQNHNGEYCAMSKYYRSKGFIYTFDDAVRLYYQSPSESLDTSPDVNWDNLRLTKYKIQNEQFVKKRQKLGMSEVL